MTYWDRLREVIDYLEGKVDIYDGEHEETLKAWNNAWDEMVWMGIKPDTAAGIKKYIRENE
jgi:hypothetical protein